MEALVIGPDFTIEDIHKIREQNYERTKDMTVAEKVAYYNNSGKEAVCSIFHFVLQTFSKRVTIRYVVRI